MKRDRVNVLIIGGNGGIGSAFVRQFLDGEPCATVYATARRWEGAAELRELAQAHPKRLCALPLDVTQEAQIAEVAARIAREGERLHWVINCVGLLHEGSLQPEKSLQQINAENLLRSFQINSIASILLAKHLLPLLRHEERSIFAVLSAKIGSIGDNRLGGWYGYRASKAALNMFVRTAAIEYKRKSPRTILVALHPGTTDTGLSQPFQKNIAAETLFSRDRTVTKLLTVINNLTEADSGEFFSWDGTRLPW